MPFPIEAPVLPMLAKRIDAIPAEGELLFEPKWDGFRVLVFRDGDELLLQSREGKPLDRYFPELREPLLAALPDRCVLDGEIVIARTDPPGGTAPGRPAAPSGRRWRCPTAGASAGRPGAPSDSTTPGARPPRSWTGWRTPARCRSSSRSGANG